MLVQRTGTYNPLFSHVIEQCDPPPSQPHPTPLADLFSPQVSLRILLHQGGYKHPGVSITFEVGGIVHASGGDSCLNSYETT